MKKTLSIILVVVMLVAIMPVAFADSFSVSPIASPSAGGTATAGSATVETAATTSLTATPNTGYAFSSWTISGENATIDNATANPATLTMGTANVTATATFTGLARTITFANGGGTGTLPADISTNTGAAVSMPVCSLTKDYYDFAGWSDGTTTTAAGGSYTVPAVAGDTITQTATWTAKTYTVTLDADGGAISSGNITSYTYGVGATLPSAVTKAGYTFAGWYDGETAVTAISTTDHGDKAYKAKWTPVDYTLTTANDGHGTMSASKTSGLHVGDVVTLEATPAAGYIFDKWTVSPGDAVISDNKLTMPAANTTVTANFKEKPAFSSTYYASVSSPSRAVITSASTKVLPAGDSYTFAAKVTASGYYIGRVYVDGVNAGSPYLDTTTGVYYYTVNNKDTSAKTHTVVFNVYDSKGVPVTGDAGIWNYVVTMAASATAAAGIIIGKNKKK